MAYTLISSDDVKFKHLICTQEILLFHDMRIWCSNTYGYSEHCVDFDFGKYSKHWGFKISFKKYYIYLLDDEELTWFKLKWHIQ